MTEETQGIAQFVPVARRWWWLVVVVVAIACGVSYYITKHTKKVYESSSVLFVNPSSTTGSIGSNSDSQAALMLASAVADMINSHRLAADLVQSVHVPLTTAQVLAELSATASADTPVITISVRDHDPQRAALIANAAAATIIALNQTDQGARYAGLKQALQQQISSTTESLTAVTGRLRALSMHPTTDPDTVATISSLSTQANALQSALTALNTQLNSLLLSQAQSNTVLTIIDHAQIPTTAVSPVLRTNLLLAGVLGLLLAGCVIAGIEFVDDSPRSQSAVEARLKLAVLAVISRFRESEGATAIIANRRRDSNAEAFKTLRTNVQFVNVDRPPRTVLVASGRPSEGKSTVAANYAVAVAQSGKSVILVDCDLRRPSQHRIFSMEPGVGLTEYLRDTRLGLSVARPTDIENLRLVSSGPIPPNPSELLGSQRMMEFIEMASQDADLVVFDTPPALVVTDASVLAPHVDGVVLVLDEEKTKMRAAALTCQLFKMVGGKILGVVVNKFDTRHAGYGGYYYYQYGGYYGADKDGGDGGTSTDYPDTHTEKRRRTHSLIRA